MDFHLGISGGNSRLIPPKKNNDAAVKDSKNVEPDNSVHYESISSLKNRIQTKQNELKSKIQEYKHFCAQYGIEPDEEKINNWNNASAISSDDIALTEGESINSALSKRLSWIEKYITEANQEIAKITTRTILDKLEAQSDN